MERISLKFKHVFTILTVITLSGFWIQDAFAYIDPGSFSMFSQVILGALVGLGITIKIYWEKIKSKLLRN